MRTLVIGGSGFIGSHVVDCLLERGHRVRVFDRKPEAFRPPLPQVEYVTGNLSDTVDLFEAMADVDAVIHLASTTVPSSSNLNPTADITGNLVAMVQLLELLRGVRLRKFVYLSSGGTVYGVPQTDPVAEDHPLRPISSYGIVKVAIENYLFMEQQLHGLPSVVLRASNPYGPRQGHTGIQGIIGTHLWRIARDEPIEIWGDGSVVRDFVHVRDMARLCVDAIDGPATGCFNAGSGQGASIAEVVEHVRQAVDRPVQPLFKPGRSFDVPRVVLDIGRVREAFGWTPRIGLAEGIRDSWAWVQGQVRPPVQPDVADLSARRRAAR